MIKRLDLAQVLTDSEHRTPQFVEQPNKLSAAGVELVLFYNGEQLLGAFMPASTMAKALAEKAAGLR